MYEHFIVVKDQEIIEYYVSPAEPVNDGEIIKLRDSDYRKFYFEINNIKIWNPDLMDMHANRLYKYINGEVTLND